MNYKICIIIWLVAFHYLCIILLFCLFTSRGLHTVKTDMEENKLLNKVVILVVFAHKKYFVYTVEPLMSHGLF